MDAFSLIQSFFSRLRCNFCSQPFSPEGIQLLRQDEGIFIVNVYCNHCRTQNGVAMVGIESANQSANFPHPELSEDELFRFAEYDPITSEDVLDAHNFFSELGNDWMRFIPQETLERCIEPETESPTD